MFAHARRRGRDSDASSSLPDRAGPGPAGRAGAGEPLARGAAGQAPTSVRGAGGEARGSATRFETCHGLCGGRVQPREGGPARLIGQAGGGAGNGRRLLPAERRRHGGAISKPLIAASDLQRKCCRFTA